MPEQNVMSMSELEGLLGSGCHLLEGCGRPFCDRLEWHFMQGRKHGPVCSKLEDVRLKVLLSVRGEGFRKVEVSCAAVERSSFLGVDSGVICNSGFLDGFLVREFYLGGEVFVFGRRPYYREGGLQKFLDERGVDCDKMTSFASCVPGWQINKAFGFAGVL